MKELKWKDFEIKDLQPNLIPNGWDSFEPYGSGKNYVENWDFESDDLREFRGENALDLRIKDNVLIGEVGDNGTTQASSIKLINNDLPKGKYMVRFSIRSNTEDISVLYRPRINNSDRIQRGYDLVPNEKNIIELEFNRTVDTEYDVYIYARHHTNTIEVGDRLELDWIQLTPVDNQHLVVEKTPLDNGLTRIRTWGGSEKGKLRFIQNSEKVGEPLSFSMYIENNGDDISLNHDTPSTNDAIEKGYKGFFETQTEVSVDKYKYIGIGTEGNLDFIASEPQFVEGDKANPVLLINELEDGREHVQVHGAYVDTKLISKEVQGFIGEPYQIKTDIENNGIEMSMDSTLGDKSIDVNKGSNSISHTGELQGQHIIIELGAKDE